MSPNILFLFLPVVKVRTIFTSWATPKQTVGQFASPWARHPKVLCRSSLSPRKSLIRKVPPLHLQRRRLILSEANRLDQRPPLLALETQSVLPELSSQPLWFLAEVPEVQEAGSRPMLSG